MDGLSKEIWAQLFPAEKESVAPIASRRDHSQDPVAHWSSPILLERAAYLRKLAKMSDGAASETLREYPHHRVMLSVRSRSGIVEVHASVADWFFVLEGSATLVTGGTVIKPKILAPGEVRGLSLSGGNPQPLRAGDVVYVAAGQPHQFLLTGNAGITSLVMKIDQTEPDLPS
jgi:mannose-6-phosphate isomerase-like protein (cupin superfamily)